MAITDRTIDVVPGGELDRLLNEADGKPLILVRDGVRFRLQREDPKPDIWANYDPERVLKVLEETAGSWRDIDTEALIAEIHEQRGQDSHGRPGE
jgi:hypothetical protein